jgi:hypothetical protein
LIGKNIYVTDLTKIFSSDRLSNDFKRSSKMINLFKDIFSVLTETKPVEFNPSTGLPLIENSQIDVGGNFYGFSNDSFDSSSSFSTSGFD